MSWAWVAFFAIIMFSLVTLVGLGILAGYLKDRHDPHP